MPLAVQAQTTESLWGLSVSSETKIHKSVVQIESERVHLQNCSLKMKICKTFPVCSQMNLSSAENEGYHINMPLAVQAQTTESLWGLSVSSETKLHKSSNSHDGWPNPDSCSSAALKSLRSQHWKCPVRESTANPRKDGKGLIWWRDEFTAHHLLPVNIWRGLYDLNTPRLKRVEETELSVSRASS